MSPKRLHLVTIFCKIYLFDVFHFLMSKLFSKFHLLGVFHVLMSTGHVSTLIFRSCLETFHVVHIWISLMFMPTNYLEKGPEHDFRLNFRWDLRKLKRKSKRAHGFAQIKAQIQPCARVFANICANWSKRIFLTSICSKICANPSVRKYFALIN